MNGIMPAKIWLSVGGRVPRPSSNSSRCAEPRQRSPGYSAARTSRAVVTMRQTRTLQGSASPSRAGWRAAVTATNTPGELPRSKGPFNVPPIGPARSDRRMTDAPLNPCMRALLVQAASPPTYWGYQHSLPFIRRDAALPPLGLATLAAHLPESWELRIRDQHLGPVSDDDLRWADAVLVSGMLVQADAMRELLARAGRLGRVTVAGGPAANTSHGIFPEALHVF